MKRRRAPGRLVRQKRPSGAWRIVAALAVVAGLAGWLAWRGLGPARPAPAAAADSAAGFDGERALSEAYARVDRKQPELSVPFFERALRMLPAARTDARVLYAAALQDLALGERPRSAVERVAALRAALGQLELGIAAAAGDEPRASLHLQRAHLLNVFGFPLDAMVELNVAATEDPQSDRISSSQIGLAARLRKPEDPRR